MTTPIKSPTPKVPPHNLEAEQAVLGALLIDKNAIIKVVDAVSAQDFYLPAHERIFAGIVDLYEKSQPIDILSLTNYLKEKKQLSDVGGSAYLAELTNQIATAGHADHYARIVREKRVLRDLIRAAGEISEGAFDERLEIEDFLDRIEQKVLSISQKSLPQSFVEVKDELKSAYERIERLHEHKGAIRGVTTGFPGIDNLLSGFQKSDLIVLGARPSLGKTTLALDIARHAAIQGQVPVAVFSLEMSKEQVIDRLISGESGVSLWQLRSGRLRSDSDFTLIQGSLDKLSKVPIFIDDSPSPTILQMRAMARRLQVEHNNLGLIVVDYLQLIQPRRNSDNMVSQVTEISRGLKQLARELNVPVLALSQLSRAVDQRDNKRPQLYDLRESGSIEQDADVVMFIYRKDRHTETASEEEQNLAEILIAKHRNGPLGTVKLRFDQEGVTFQSIDEHHVDPLESF